MRPSEGRGIPRFAMEIAVAALTGAFGIAVCVQSREAGTGWTEMGPDAGYFPFRIGLLIALGSAVNLAQGIFEHRASGEIFIDGTRLKVVAQFLLPMAVFGLLSIWLGLYVGTALYIASTMCLQGGYKWWVSLLAGVGIAIFFFFVFEIGFQVPLLKGPLEAWLGIY